MADRGGPHIVSVNHAGVGGASSNAGGGVSGGYAFAGELATARDRVVIEPESPVTVLLTSGREVHALRFHEQHTGEEDAPVVVVDSGDYVYIIAPDMVAAVIVHGTDLAEEMLAP